jgi:MarR family transcriptional regulator, organic hydroperoxide resistance regulator
MPNSTANVKKQSLKRSGEAQTMLRHWREAVPNDRLAHLVRDASRAFLRALQVRLADHDVPFGHWAFLRILWVHDGLTQKQLSDEAGVMEPTTFTAVKAMEAHGWIERRQIEGNRKNIHVFLTPFGRALEAKLVPLAQATNQIGIAGISASDLAVTRKALLAVIANLAADE